jgi:uncharacterized Tic20 family protein
MFLYEGHGWTGWTGLLVCILLILCIHVPITPDQEADMTERPQDERLLAALSHAAIVTGAMAPVVGIVVYITQKEKSAYAAGQGLQAAVYQLGVIVLTIILWAIWTACYTLSLVPLIANAEQYGDAPPPFFWASMLSMFCPLIIMGVWGLYGLYGAVRCWSGADFRYWLLDKLGLPIAQT